jgi:hypothetical protein
MTDVYIPTIPADRLAGRITEQRTSLETRVSERLLESFPEVQELLHLEGDALPIERLNEYSTRRFCDIVRGVLLFETMSIAEQELAWAKGVLHREGVSSMHQSKLIRWFFAEVHSLDLDESERHLAHNIEQHMLEYLDVLYS